MSMKNLIFLVALLCLLPACRCQKDDPVTPVPDTTTHPTTTTVQTTTPTPAKPWDVVGDLQAIEGRWGGEGEEDPWVLVESRQEALDAGLSWTYPYPWLLQFHDPRGAARPMDCGLFPELKEGEWRLGYCLGSSGGTRKACKVVLRHKDWPSSWLSVQIDEQPPVEVDRSPEQDVELER